jgi:hypothetical protein
MLDKSRLPVTVWPSFAIPLPALRVRYHVELVRGRFLVLLPSDERELELPDEFYLRNFLDVDGSDPRAVCDFFSIYGHMTPFGQMRNRPPATAGNRSRTTGWNRLRDDAERASRNGRDVREVAGESVSPGLVRHFGEFGFYQRAMRGMVRLWALVSGTVSMSEFLAEWDIADWPLDEPFSDDVARVDLAQVLNGALVPFHARLNVMDATGRESLRGHMDVYNLMCLQLFNHIAEGATYRDPCPHCGRLFVHQQGGAKYRQHRNTGLTYCSPSCQRAAKQKRYRENLAKRKRAQSNQVDHSTEGGTHGENS